jgi:signal transduction histidine kinase/ligand-binding sensor domain-containing protein
MIRRVQVVWFIFSFIIQPAFSQNSTILFSKLDSLNGTPIGKITGISQDPAGIMWFCGQHAQCLYRYDGTKLSSLKRDIKNPNSLGVTNLENVYADDRGMIWLAGLGLDMYNPSTGVFKHYVHRDDDSSSLSAGIINTILMDHLGNIWVGTGHGLDRLDVKTEKFIHHRNDQRNPKSLSCDDVRTLYEDKNGLLWAGTGFPWDGKERNGGLNRMNPDGSFTRYMHDPKNPESLLSNKVRAIFEDRRGNFWVGTSGEGLHLMNREKGIFMRHLFDPKHPDELSGPAVKPGDKADGITFIGEDNMGALWIGCYMQGLTRYDPVKKEISRFKGGNGFPDSTIWKGFVSRDGTLWVATEFSELLYRADPGSLKIKNIVTGMQSFDLLTDKEQVWMTAFNGGGLMQFDKNNSLTHLFKHNPADPNSISSDTVFGLFKKPSEDTIWIGTKHGVCVLNPDTKKFSRMFYGKNISKLDGQIGHIIKESNRIFWLGTFGNGLIRYDRENDSVTQWLPVPKDSASIGSPNLTTVYEDRDQNIWVGTWEDRQGIWKLNQKTGIFQSYLPGIVGRYFYEDNRGEFWAGTNNGLYHYNKHEDNFSAFFDMQSTITDVPTIGMIEDAQKNLWLNTGTSIVKINSERDRYFVFGKKFGIETQGFFLGPLCETPDGQVRAGNEQGFYSFFPERLSADMTPLHLIVTDFFFSEVSGSTVNDSSFLTAVENKNLVSLAHNQNNFGFKFTVNDYRSAEAIRYYTMLENYDPVWHQTGMDKTVYYFNLAPGDYVFRIKAFNSEETRGERQIKIHISQPWWKTGWAYTVYALLLTFLIIAVSRFQKQWILRNERHRTQEKELAQAKEIEKAYTELKATQAQLIQSEKMASLGELTAGIAHEIQNPLNFVNNFSEVNMELTVELKEALSKLNVDPKEKIVLEEIANSINDNEDKINHHGRRADAIVKGMLQHSRISSGLKEPTNINQLADEFLRLAYHGLRAKDKTFNTGMKTDFDSGIGNINIVTQDIGRVLLNLYNNAFYAVAEKKKQQGSAFEPCVEVITEKEDKKVKITVRDNGNGIPKHIREKIFQPFFTTKPTGQGTGLGLSLSFDIIKAHGGVLDVDTAEGQYTSFTIRLPA